MAIVNCKICGIMFDAHRSDETLCSYCREQDKEYYTKVKQYLYEHRMADINEICEACEVDEDFVIRWVQEERLEFLPGVDSGVRCKACGRIVTTGRLCKRCRFSLKSAFR